MKGWLGEQAPKKSDSHCIPKNILGWHGSAVGDGLVTGYGQEIIVTWDGRLIFWKLGGRMNSHARKRYKKRI